jgi:hypothetical protein
MKICQPISGLDNSLFPAPCYLFIHLTPYCIDVRIQRTGLEEIKKALARTLPEAVIIDDDEAVEWEHMALAKEIRMKRTPGKLLMAYRERAGLSVVELANKTGIKYTNISAMEHDIVHCINKY